MRAEEGDKNITNCTVAGFQVTMWKLPAKYSVALVIVMYPVFKNSYNMLLGK